MRFKGRQGPFRKGRLVQAGQIATMYVSLLIQVVAVVSVGLAFHRRVHPELNFLIAAMFVTTPVWSYGALGSEGLVFMLDLVAPVLLLGRWLMGDWRFGRITGLFALMILALPLAYAPLSFLIVSPAYVPFHTFLLLSFLTRSAVLAVVLMIVERHLKAGPPNDMVRLFCIHMAVLMTLGASQYFLSVDLVVFERIRGVEETAEYFLDPDRGIFYGLGFLGLFRGAVAQMAALALVWAIWAAMLRDSTRSFLWVCYAVPILAAACVVGSLSRSGLAAFLVVAMAAFFVDRKFRRIALLYLGLALAMIHYFDIYARIGDLSSILEGRFDLLELSGQRGSGVTRLEAIFAYANHVMTAWQPWLIGVGGFNPVELQDQYGVFGMHNGYVDVLARYGLVVGTVILGALAAGAIYMFQGLTSPGESVRIAAKAFVPLLLGTAVLSLSQESLTFYGSAGYLAAVHLWVVLLAVAVVRGKRTGDYFVSQRDVVAGGGELDRRNKGPSSAVA
ncbi:MAG: O-antigen ligase family protein [Gammaproteobacteria bacterium]